ncbi:MAG: OmpA family protein [Rhodospirillales bacterium]
MATSKLIPQNRLIKGQHAAFGLVFGLTAVLSGCSSVPDAINPVEWYKSTEEFFTGDDKEGQTARKTDTKDNQLKADRGKPAPGADKPFPNLSKVPSGLRADTEGRKYAKQISRQGEAKNVLTKDPEPAKPAPAPAQVASTPPPPVASPAPPVSRAQAKMNPPSTAQKSLPPVRLRPPPQMRAPEPSPALPPAPKLREPSQQLATMPAPRMVQPTQPAPSLSYDPFATVVVSSKGMEMDRNSRSQAMMAQPMQQQVLPSRSLAQLTQRATPGYPAGAVMARQPALGQGMVKVATILFPNGSSRLSVRDRQILSDVAQIQRESGGRPLVVVGHASSRTRDMNPARHRNVNLKLSQTRANRVARALRRLGVPGQSVQTQAVGDSQPIYYEVMPSGEAGNRRADIYINY